MPLQFCGLSGLHVPLRSAIEYWVLGTGYESLLATGRGWQQHGIHRPFYLLLPPNLQGQNKVLSWQKSSEKSLNLQRRRFRKGVRTDNSFKRGIPGFQ
jgi:hypothetical protein